MPNRILKESICSSADLDKLSAFEETVFYRLIVNVDDYGRIDARPTFLKSKLFVTKKSVTEDSVKHAVSKLATIGLVEIYVVDDDPYLLLPKWSKHQRMRNSKEKFPPPERGTCDKFSQLAATCGESRPESNPIQSESNPNPNPNISTERSDDRPVHDEAVVSLPLNDKSTFSITQTDIDHYAELYPAVDVLQELRNMIGWLDANPAKRKTRTGIKRFVSGWLSRTQDRGQLPGGNDRIYSSSRKQQFIKDDSEYTHPTTANAAAAEWREKQKRLQEVSL